MKMATQVTPLWPAGHLPQKRGDRMRPAPGAYRVVPHTQAFPLIRVARRGPISPLVGEMAGRPEGVDRSHLP